MAGKVRATPGADTYIEASAAKTGQLATVSLKNRAGEHVAPDAASSVKAAEAGDWSAPGFAVEMIDLDAAEPWPIVSPTFVPMPSNPAAEKVMASVNTMRFFDWASRPDQGLSRQAQTMLRHRNPPRQSPHDFLAAIHPAATIDWPD